MLSGDASFKPKLESKEAEIDADLKAIDEVEGHHGQALTTKENWNTLRAHWLDLQAKVVTLTPKSSFEAHTAFNDEILAFLAFVADRSGLTLDPDLDSYYLQDSLVGKLPRLAEAVGQARGAGMGVVSRKRITLDEKIQLHVMAALASAAHRETVKNFEAAFAANVALKSALEEPVKGLAGGSMFIALLKSRVLDSAAIEIEANEYYRVGTEAIDRVFALSDVSGTTLDELIQTRIKRAVHDQRLAISVAFGALALAVYLLAGFYRGVRMALAELGRSIKDIEAGHLTTSMVAASRDEVGAMLTAMDKMRRKLANTISEVRS